MKKITRYQAWFDQIEGQPQHTKRGSFITALFSAYMKADADNKTILKTAFPNEFLFETVEIIES